MKKLWLLALVALLVPFAACGSSEGSGGDEQEDEQEETTTTEASEDDSTDSTDTTEVSTSDLSFDEWVVAADAVCADFEAQSDELDAGLEEATTVEELAPAFEALIPLYEDFLEEIEALGIPEDGPPEVSEWVALIGEGPDRIQPLADAAAEGDEETFTALSSELEGYDQDLADAATAIGFQDCSQG